MTQTKEWFSIDKAGLGKLLELRGKYFAILELLQNAFDEDGVTRVVVLLEPLTANTARLFVSDDSKAGYADLSHAYTLFAPSTKLGEAEKRGRFNLGEKLVLALCNWAEITTTTGAFRFDDNGRTEIANKTKKGSTFEAEILMTEAEVKDTVDRVHAIIPPAHITTTVNGAQIRHRKPVHSFTVSLPTEIADDEGRLRPTTRKAKVSLYDPAGDEVASIYEMGIPVVEDESAKWHVDISQKVPLNMTRDNVTPAYLRTIRTNVLNEAAAMLTEADTSATWVKEAVQDKNADSRAVKTVIDKMYGEDAVIFDPTNHEANRRAVAEGRKIIYGPSFSKEGFANIKASGVQSAGKVYPAPKDLGNVPGHTAYTPESPEMTPAMALVMTYAARFAKNVLGFDVEVNVYPDLPTHHSGDNLMTYGVRKLNMSASALGKRFFDTVNQQYLDSLLIHALAHDKAYSHNGNDFWNELCRIGARAKMFAGDIGSIAEEHAGLRDLERGLR